MKTLLLLLFTLTLFTGCAKPKAPLATVPSVDLARYQGRWYEIARYEHFFEKGCTNVTATYKERQDGKIGVINRCVLEDGTRKEAHGVAQAVDATNTKLRVSFFWPFYGDYWILALDDDYTYALIGEPSREYLWILSRSKELDAAAKQRLLDLLPALGYQSSTLIWTPQN
ncbi:MAG: lipocalin family protein [Epsilonproteobacteria bacterium]|nr:lipocalin family protein [Campylobacterota bacterium]